MDNIGEKSPSCFDKQPSLTLSGYGDNAPLSEGGDTKRTDAASETENQRPTLQEYTDRELVAELKRRGYDCHKWPKEPQQKKDLFAWYDMGEWSDLQPDWELHTKLHT